MKMIKNDPVMDYLEDIYSSKVTDIDSFVLGMKCRDEFIPISHCQPQWFQEELVKFRLKDSKGDPYCQVLLVWRAWSETEECDIYTIAGTDRIVVGEPIAWKPVYMFK